MELKQLKSFVAVVKHKNFTTAAKELHMSQPTVSMHIHQLEDELNKRLLIRSTKSIEITPVGEELYTCALNMFQVMDHFMTNIDDNNQKIIHLATSTIPSAYILPEILSSFGKEYSNIYFNIHQSDSAEVIDGLLNGVYDIGMIGMPCHDDRIECIPFYKDSMTLITPVNIEFLELQKYPKNMDKILTTYPIIVREKGSGSKKSADLLLEEMNIQDSELNIIARINDQESIKNMVSQGLGISIISKKAAENYVREKRLLSFELNSETANRHLYIIYRKGYIVKPYIKKFIRYVKNYYEN